MTRWNCDAAEQQLAVTDLRRIEGQRLCRERQPKVIDQDFKIVNDQLDCRTLLFLESQENIESGRIMRCNDRR